MNAPVRIMGAQAAEILVDKVRRVRNYKVPLLAGRYAPQTVGVIDRHTIGQAVIRNGAAAGCDRLGIDVGKAKRFTQAMGQHRKPNKARAGAPHESPCLSWQPIMLQERDEILSEPAPATVEMIFVRDLNAFERRLLVRKEGLEPRIDVTAAELLQNIGHCGGPKPIA